MEQGGRMNIRRSIGKKNRLRKILLYTKGGIDMATISFEREIKLSPRAVKKVIEISNEPVKEVKRNTNAIQALNKGEEILKQLFSR